MSKELGDSFNPIPDDEGPLFTPPDLKTVLLYVGFVAVGIIISLIMR